MNLNGFQLKLLAFDADLNNSLAFSFPTPEKWRACTGNSTTSHSGKISILLGSDNPPAFPKEEEHDNWGAVLWRIILTHQPIIYRAIDPELITWTDPEHKFSVNTVCVLSVSMQSIQEQLLLTVSAENFSDPTKLSFLSKERGIKEIMENTVVEKDNNKVLVNYLYTEKLVNLGENFFGTTRIIQTLHNKIYPKPEVANEMDKYIQEQVYNGNYIEITP